MGRVLAVCGMPASGKGEFAAILKDRGIPILSMGDMIREEVRHRQLQESPEIFGEIADTKIPNERIINLSGFRKFFIEKANYLYFSYINNYYI